VAQAAAPAPRRDPFPTRRTAMTPRPARLRAQLLAALIIGLASGPLAAQSVWRCGPDGRSFQATPCADGHRIALRPAPGADAVAEARAVAAREREALDTLAAERRARHAEAQARGLGPAGIVPRAAPVPPEGKRPRHPDSKPGKGAGQPPWFRPSAPPPRPAG